MKPAEYGILFVVSAAILAYEIFLMGLFALIQWHHFASMIISVALLGFGVSGTMLAIWREWFVARWRNAFLLAFGLFAVFVGGATLVVPRIPFNPFRLIWDASELLHLLAYYVLLLAPFTAGASVVGLAFLKPGASISRVYCVNLLGSGLGVFAGLLLGFAPIHPTLSEYKGLSKYRLLPNAEIVERAAHPLGRVVVLSAPALRVAPGLSLAYRGGLPPQQAIFVNGDGPSALMFDDARGPSMEFLGWMPNALPYRLLRAPRVLVLGAGGGMDVLQAARFTSEPIVAVESHPAVASIAQRSRRLPLDIRIADARWFVRATGEKFDLIQISLLESFGSASMGAHSMHENYLYTLEAFTDYFARLNDGGMLVITRWLKSPPRDEVRLFLTAVRALEQSGVREPGRHLIVVRGLQTSTLFAKRTPWTANEMDTARQFCEEREFDLDHFPGTRPAGTERFHKLAHDTYAFAFHEILSGDRGRFLQEYLFDVHPTTDDRPFFFQHFRWSHARELWKLFRQQALPLMEWGYLVSLATLLQTIVVSVTLIVVPLACAARVTRHAPRVTVLVYFAALGLGFLLLEMALLQKLALFLAHPILAAALVVATFLVFAGIGSATAWMQSPFAPLCAVIVIGGLELLFLPRLLSATFGIAPVAQAALMVLGIAPLAYFMGMPFPLGLRRVAQNAPVLVPWAWGINGCLSVVAASLTPVLAIHFGFNAVIAAGLSCYFVAALVCDRGTLAPA